MVRTKRFQRTMDKLGSFRVSKPIGWLLLYAMPIAAGLGFFLFLNQLGVLLSPKGAAVASYVRTLSPLANLGLPGINPYLPVVDGWIALFVAMIVHEGAHGVIARSLGLPVKSSGLLFFLIVPIGAFVDVDEEALKTTRASYSLRVLAGGAGINLLAGVLSLLLLVSLVSGMTPLADGAGIVNVAPGGPAATAGVMPGDIVVRINGQNVTDLNTVLGPNTTLQSGQTVNLTVVRGGQFLNIGNIKLACCDEIINTKTNVTVKYPYIGVVQETGSDLRTAVSQYSAPLSNLYLYICIPTLPVCQQRVPYSDTLAPFYSSSLGSETAPVMNLLYWLFFLNFNLALFNALPIYPLDGGQAFKVGVKALGKFDDETATRVTTGVTLAVVGMLVAVVGGPYLLALM